MLTLVEGIRVPDSVSFGAQAAERGDYVDLGLMKSVEILRGPASTHDGSNGLASAVSLPSAIQWIFWVPTRRSQGWAASLIPLPTCNFRRPQS